MTWEEQTPSWVGGWVPPGDDVAAATAALWSASSAARATDPAATVPSGVVTETLDLVTWLDDLGAGLGSLGPLATLATRVDLLGWKAAGRISCGGASRLLRTADGWIALALARDDDVALVPAWLCAEMAPGTPTPEVWELVTRLVSDRRADALVERAALVGLACARVGEQTDVRRVLARRVRRTGRDRAAPGDVGAPGGVAGRTVVTLAALWAGPLAADVLARLGARVVTVESATRPDGARAHPELFAELHRRTRLVTVDFASTAGRRRLLDLLLDADVVIEASRPRALRQLGIEAEAVVASGPCVWASITAHGRSDPHAVRIGYGDDAAVAGGLVGDTPHGPTFVADAVADPLAGLTTAAAIVQAVSERSRCVLDIALSRVAAASAGRAGLRIGGCGQ